MLLCYTTQSKSIIKVYLYELSHENGQVIVRLDTIQIDGKAFVQIVSFGLEGFCLPFKFWMRGFCPPCHFGGGEAFVHLVSFGWEGFCPPC